MLLATTITHYHHYPHYSYSTWSYSYHWKKVNFPYAGNEQYGYKFPMATFVGNGYTGNLNLAICSYSYCTFPVQGINFQCA